MISHAAREGSVVFFCVRGAEPGRHAAPGGCPSGRKKRKRKALFVLTADVTELSASCMWFGAGTDPSAPPAAQQPPEDSAGRAAAPLLPSEPVPLTSTRRVRSRRTAWRLGWNGA